jgi:glutathione S-transferase
MIDQKLVLWGESKFQSPYVFSCWVALQEKAIPFELRTMSLEAGEHRRGDYPSRSVTGRVPSLQHGDLWLAESSAIDEYLEDAFGPPRHPAIYPQGATERARARQLQAWLRSDLVALRDERPTSSVFCGEPVKPLTAAGKEAADRVVRATEALLPPGATHLFGAFSIADADLAMMLQRLVANGDPVPARVKAYAEVIWKRPSIQSWLSKVRPPRS